MNKYQKKKSKEIKAIMRIENSIGGRSWCKYEFVTYKQAKKMWKNMIHYPDLPLTPIGYPLRQHMKFKPFRSGE